MILRHDIEPMAYTVDADFLNGSSSVMHLQLDPAQMIVDTCEELGFAVVRNVLSVSDFEELREESRVVLGHHDELGWTQRIESVSVTKVDKTMECRTELPNLSSHLIGEFATRLWKASKEGDRLYTPDFTIGTAYVMRQLRSSQVGKHRDPVSGVMCELSLQGKAMMGFWRGHSKLASVVVRPNDMVVMPARTIANNDRSQRPIKHNVINITSKEDNGGERLALVYNYGRTPGTQ